MLLKVLIKKPSPPPTSFGRSRTYHCFYWVQLSHGDRRHGSILNLCTANSTSLVLPRTWQCEQISHGVKILPALRTRSRAFRTLSLCVHLTQFRVLALYHELGMWQVKKRVKINYVCVTESQGKRGEGHKVGEQDIRVIMP